MEINDKLNVLILGNSLRELVLAEHIQKSPRLEKLYYISTREKMDWEEDEMENYASRVKISLGDHAQIIKFCQQVPIQLVIPGSSSWQSSILVEYFKNKGIAVFPTISENAESLYKSRLTWLDLLKRQSVLTPGNSVFHNVDSVASFVETRRPFPIVAKNQNLFNPVRRVCYNFHDVQNFLNATIKAQEEDEHVILEKYIDAPIVSFMVWVTKKNIVVFPHLREVYFDAHSGQEYCESGYIKAGNLYYKQYQSIEHTIITPIVDGIYKQIPDFQGLVKIVVSLYKIPYVLDVRLDWDIGTLLTMFTSLKMDFLDWVSYILQSRSGDRFEEKILEWTRNDFFFIFFDDDVPETRQCLTTLRQNISSFTNIHICKGKPDSGNRKNLSTICMYACGSNLETVQQNFSSIWDKSLISGDSFVAYKMADLWELSKKSIIPTHA